MRHLHHDLIPCSMGCSKLHCFSMLRAHAALSQRNDEAANILEKYGADRCHDLKLVIENEIRQQEEETKNENAGSENGAGTGIRAFTDETFPVSNSGRIGSCEEEDENIDDMLLQAVSKLGGSSPYAKF